MHRRAAACLLLSLLAITAACTDETAVTGRRGRDQESPALSGVVLGISSPRVEPGVFSFSLPEGHKTALVLPQGSGRVLDAFWSKDGEALAFIGGQQGSRLYRLSDQDPPEPVGAALEGVVGQTGQGPGMFLAALCGSPRRSAVMVLDIAAASWRKVAPGCRGAISPDGTSVAYSPDGRSIWTTGADGSAPGERLIRLSEIDGPAEEGGGELGGTIVWGESGIAFTLLFEGKASLVIAALGGTADVYPLLPPNAGYSPANLLWQPGGGLLGVFTAARHNENLGVLRTFDAAKRSAEVLDISRDSFAGVLWSPEGDLVLSGGPFDVWRFFDLQGTSVGRLPPPQSYPVDWRS